MKTEFPTSSPANPNPKKYNHPQQKKNSSFRQQKVSFIKEAQLTPKDQPSNLEVELIHTLLMLPQ